MMLEPSLEPIPRRYSTFTDFRGRSALARLGRYEPCQAGRWRVVEFGRSGFRVVAIQGENEVPPNVVLDDRVDVFDFASPCKSIKAERQLSWPRLGVGQRGAREG